MRDDLDLKKKKIEKKEQDKVNEVLARVASGELEIPGSMPKSASKIELPA